LLVSLDITTHSRNTPERARNVVNFVEWTFIFAFFRHSRYKVSDFCAVHYVWPLMIRSSWKKWEL
jgi:hypothetical protein